MLAVLLEGALCCWLFHCKLSTAPACDPLVDSGHHLNGVAHRLRPGLASKWLAAMSPAEALAETEQMTATSVSAALSAMKPWQAAEIVQVGYQCVHILF